MCASFCLQIFCVQQQFRSYVGSTLSTHSTLLTRLNHYPFIDFLSLHKEAFNYAKTETLLILNHETIFYGYWSQNKNIAAKWLSSALGASKQNASFLGCLLIA